jgi:hypothetical protein
VIKYDKRKLERLKCIQEKKYQQFWDVKRIPNKTLPGSGEIPILSNHSQLSV